MVHNTWTVHQLKSRRMAHKFWRTLLQYLTTCPLQLSPILDRHSCSTLQMVVTPYESVDLLITTDSETMRGGDVVYWPCYTDTVYLSSSIYLVLSILHIILLSAHAQCVLSYILYIACYCSVWSRISTIQRQYNSSNNYLWLFIFVPSRSYWAQPTQPSGILATVYYMCRLDMF